MTEVARTRNVDHMPDLRAEDVAEHPSAEFGETAACHDLMLDFAGECNSAEPRGSA
jgi:hypothetical protein